MTRQAQPAQPVQQPQFAAPEENTEQSANQTDVVRSTGSMAVATLLSRITGFIRTVLITSALGGAVASAFNTANILPNMITEIVLGSVLTALVVPVLVRAEKEDPDRGAAFIRRLFTLTVTLLTVVTLIAIVAAPLLTRMLLNGDGKVNAMQATSFAYLLLPQILFYGLFSLFMAILNTKEVFRPGAWAPVVNNLVSIAVLSAYLLVPGKLNPEDTPSITDPHVLLLGLGTTAGVIVQCLIMLPALKRLKIDLRPLWGIDDRLKQFGGMALAIVSYVAISQVGYIFNNRIADSADASAPVIYMQHWQLLQVPYGIIGVTLLTAIMPRLSRNAADGDDRAVVRDLTMGTKLTFIALIPIIIFFTALGPDIGNALFGYGNFSTTEARTLGLTLSFSAFTLIPYALVMLHLRVFYAREEAWTPTFIIAGITVTKVTLAFMAPLLADRPSDVVVLLGAANGFGFVAGAIVGSFLLRRRLGYLQTLSILHTTMWAVFAGVCGMGVTIVLRYALRALPYTFVDLVGMMGMRESLGLLLEMTVLGLVFVVVTAVVISKSELPEVVSIGRSLRRLPGIGRFIKPADTDIDAKDPLAEKGRVDPREVPAQVLATETFTAVPAPPPMSAGVVRGPRLVPGAAVSDGRFRLMRHYGSTTQAQFWHAREQSTGRDVALTFVDTCGTPEESATPRQAAIDAAGVVYRTDKLAALNLPAVANNIETIRYRTGCVVVADWVPGSTIKAVADSDQDLSGQAVAQALAPLTQSVAYAHEAKLPLGLCHRDQLRVTEWGEIVLAFPVVMPRATEADDNAALASAIELLSDRTNSPALEQATEHAQKIRHSTADSRGPATEEMRGLASQLDAIAEAALQRQRPPQHPHNAIPAGPPQAPQPAPAPQPQPHAQQPYAQQPHAQQPQPHAQQPYPVHQTQPPHPPQPQWGEGPHMEEPQNVSGFGAKGMSGPATAGLIAIAAVAVIVVALLTAFFVSVVGKDNPDSPVSPSISNEDNEAQSVNSKLPVVIRPLGVEFWRGKAGSDQDLAAGSLENEDLGVLLDTDTETKITLKPNVAIKMMGGESTPPPALELHQVIVDAETEGINFKVYGLTEDNFNPTALSQVREIASGKLSNGRNQIDIRSKPQVVGVIVVIEAGGDIFAQPEDQKVEMQEMSLVGKRI